MVNRKDILKAILWGIFCLFIFVNILLINVVLHEYGHYAAANYYDLDPEIKYNFENITGAGFSLKGVPIASTSFIDNGDKNEMVVIASMGPFINLIMGLFFVFLFIIFKDKRLLGEILVIGMIVSLGSFVMNLLPFSGSDGALIFRLS